MFKEDDVVVYQNGDNFELGIVKSVCDNGDCFVWYHTGDTTARTPKEYLHKLSNAYAFHVIRLDTEGNERRGWNNQCPYCGSDNIDLVDEDDDSTKYICRDCKEDFVVLDNGHVTTRNGRRLA